MASGIPGLDVDEIRPTTIEVGPTGAAVPPEGPTLRNPSFSSGTSPQAAEFRASMARDIGPRPPIAAGAEGAGTAARVGGRVASALRAAGPVLRGAGAVGAGLGTVSSFGDYKLADPDVDSSAMGTLRAVGRGDFQGARASLGKGLLETGMDLGSSLANTADYLVPGKAPVSSAYGKMLRGAFGDQLIDNSGTPGSVGPQLPGGGTALPEVTPTAPAQAPGGAPTPNTAQALRADPLTSQPYQAGAAPAQPGAGAIQPNVLEGNHATASNDDVLRAAELADQYGPGAHGGTGLTGFGDTGNFGANSEHNRNFNATNLRDAISENLRLGGRQGAARAQVLTDALEKELGNTSAESIAAGRERGETLRNNATLANSRLLTAANNAVAMRGQDAALLGHRLNNEFERTRLGIEQANRDRAYKLDEARYGTEVAEKNRTASEQADNALQKKLENTFRTTDDKGNDVADTAKVASYNAAVQATLPSLQKMLQATGTPAALQHANELETRGSAALTPQDHDKLMQLFKTRELLRGARSHLPGGAELSDSSDLTNFMQKPGTAGVSQQPFTPNRVEFRGGSSATPSDLSIPGGANAILPDWFKVRSDDLTRGLRLQ